MRAAMILLALVAFVVPVQCDTVGVSDSFGLSVAIKLAKTAFEVGEPIPYEITVTNTSGQASKQIVQESSDMFPRCDYRIVVEDSSGKPLPLPQEVIMISRPIGSATLAPGQSLTRTGFLNRWAKLSGPGAYSAHATWDFLTNPTDKIGGPATAFTITAATEDSRNRRYEEAAAAFSDAADGEARSRALLVLTFTLDPRAIPTVAEATADPKLGYTAADLLWVFPDKQAVRDAMVEEIREHGPNDIIIFTVSHFAVPGERIVPVYAKWINKGGSKQRAAALRGLGMVRGYVEPKLKGPILDALKDPSPDVRNGAILALGGGTYGDTLSEVMQVAEHDKDAHVRGQAAIALAWYKNDKVVPLLRNMLRDPDRMVRYDAANGLDGLKTPAATEALEDCAKSGEPGADDCSRILRQRQSHSR